MSDGAAGSASDWRYLAFVSYSRKDNPGPDPARQWAAWLKQAVEGCSIPDALVGRETHHGMVLGELPPVFLDTENLKAGGELGRGLEEALERSCFMIVICSPESARSPHVAREVEHFIEMGRKDRILPVVVDGGLDRRWAPESYIPAPLLETDEESGEVKNLFIDFRVHEQVEESADKIVKPGWCDPQSYRAELRRKGNYSSALQRRLVADYVRDHAISRFKVLATLLGVEPYQLVDQERRRFEEQSRRRRKLLLGAVAVALVMMSLAGVTTWSMIRAEKARASAEKSLLLVGDANEQALGLVSEVVLGGLARLEPDERQEAAREIQQRCDEYLAEITPGAVDPESRHVRSVLVNARGRIARDLRQFGVARGLFEEALRTRRALLDEGWNEGVARHGVAVSHDLLGDLFVLMSADEEVPESVGDQLILDGIGHYRDGAEVLFPVAEDDRGKPQWKHALAVSRFKLADALYRSGDKEAALAELERGLPFAREAVASDLDYAKWDAHLGLYCCQIGLIHGISGRTEEARRFLGEGIEIFEGLEEEERLAEKHREWLAFAEATMSDLEHSQ